MSFPVTCQDSQTDRLVKGQAATAQVSWALSASRGDFPPWLAIRKHALPDGLQSTWTSRLTSCIRAAFITGAPLTHSETRLREIDYHTQRVRLWMLRAVQQLVPVLMKQQTIPSNFGWNTATLARHEPVSPSLSWLLNLPFCLVVCFFLLVYFVDQCVQDQSYEAPHPHACASPKWRITSHPRWQLYWIK